MRRANKKVNSGKKNGNDSTGSNGDEEAIVALNVMPITVAHILNCTDGKIVIEGTEAKMISIVGTVEKLETGPNKQTYEIRDDFGTAQVDQWSTGEENTNTLIRVKKGDFCRVVGTMKRSGEENKVVALTVQPLTSANELTNHLLESVWNPMKLTQLRKRAQAKSLTGYSEKNETFKYTGNKNSNGFDSFQTMIYNSIKSTKETQGKNRLEINKELKNRMNAKDVDFTLEFLCSNGHIYSTIDEDHFKVTEE